MVAWDNGERRTFYFTVCFGGAGPDEPASEQSGSKSSYKLFGIGWALWTRAFLILQMVIALLTDFRDHLVQYHNYYPSLPQALRPLDIFLWGWIHLLWRYFIIECVDDVLNGLVECSRWWPPFCIRYHLWMLSYITLIMLILLFLKISYFSSFVSYFILYMLFLIRIPFYVLSLRDEIIS